MPNETKKTTSLWPTSREIMRAGFVAVAFGILLVPVAQLGLRELLWWQVVDTIPGIFLAKGIAEFVADRLWP